MRTFMLLATLVALTSSMQAVEAYKPFGIGLGTAVYDIPGYPKIAKLIENGYALTVYPLQLDGKPCTSKEEVGKWLEVYTTEEAERYITLHRPDLAKPSGDDAKRRAAGSPLTYLPFGRGEVAVHRSVMVHYDARTGTVYSIEAKLVSNDPAEMPEYQAILARIIEGAASTCSDRQVFMRACAGVHFGTTPKSHRFDSDGCRGCLNWYLAQSEKGGAMTFDNSYTGTPQEGKPNPLGELVAGFGINQVEGKPVTTLGMQYSQRILPSPEAVEEGLIKAAADPIITAREGEMKANAAKKGGGGF